MEATSIMRRSRGLIVATTFPFSRYFLFPRIEEATRLVQFFQTFRMYSSLLISNMLDLLIRQLYRHILMKGTTIDIIAQTSTNHPPPSRNPGPAQNNSAPAPPTHHCPPSPAPSNPSHPLRPLSLPHHRRPHPPPAPSSASKRYCSARPHHRPWDTSARAGAAS